MLENIVPLISAAFGSVFGFFFVLSGFKDSQKTDVLQSNPRIKNLVWILGGAFTAVFVDWKIFTNGEVSASLRGQALAYYMGATCVSVALTLVVVSAGIYLNARLDKSPDPKIRHSAFQLLMTFLHYGYPKYNELYADIKKNAAPEEIHNRENMAQLGSALATSIAISLRDLKPEASRQHRLATVDDLLKAIETTVLLMSGSSKDLVIQSNYMVRVAKVALQAEGQINPLFVFGNKERYEKYLVLRRYNGRRGIEVCLPVEPRGSSHPLLPGAPEAFSSGEYRLINCASSQHGKNLPKSTKDEVNRFFKTANYKSVISLPLLRGRKVIGILNLESNKLDILGQGDDMVRRVARVLQPYCLLLGEIVGALEEEARR